MIIICGEWRITSAKLDYQLHRQNKSGRWVAVGYYPDLSYTCTELLERRLRSETTKYVINTSDAATARECTAKLIKKIDEVREEISEAIKNAN